MRAERFESRHLTGEGGRNGCHHHDLTGISRWSAATGRTDAVSAAELRPCYREAEHVNTAIQSFNFDVVPAE